MNKLFRKYLVATAIIVASSTFINCDKKEVVQETSEIVKTLDMVSGDELRDQWSVANVAKTHAIHFI